MKRQNLDDVYVSYVRDIYRYLYSLCRNHHTAEDLMQETFCRAYLYLEDCRDEAVKPWLFRVAYNAFIDYTRKAKRSTVKEDAFFLTLGHESTPESSLMLSESMREAEEAVWQLPDGQRQALLLYEIHGLSYKEAAGIMDVGLSQFKILLFRARQKLRQIRNAKETGE